MEENVNVTELFGCDVFNDAVMEERLPKKVYKELKETIEEGKELSLEIADVVANSPSDGNEGLGDQQGRDPLHALVPADDRCDC